MLLAALANAGPFAALSPAYSQMADDWSPWMIRGRVLAVVPRDSGRVDTIAGSGVNISTSVVPELDITYFLSPNIAAEIILGVTPHKVTGSGTIAGVSVGKAWLLPPTVTLQYHFTNFGAFKPYVGAGPNFTVFFSQKAAGGTVTAVDIKNTFGFALQAGFDYMLDEHWGFNFDVKKIFLRPDVDLTVGGVATTGKLNIDPWIIGAGGVYRF